MSDKLRYKVVIGIIKVDEEQYPGMKDFNTALNEAVDELYIPIFNTFRVTAIAGNILYSVICELNDTPNFIGGGTGFKV